MDGLDEKEKIGHSWNNTLLSPRFSTEVFLLNMLDSNYCMLFEVHSLAALANWMCELFCFGPISANKLV